MLVALDANVWISESLLRSATGAAFLHAVGRMDAKVLLPDVTRDEVIAGVQRAGLDAVARVNRGFSTIQALTGTRSQYEAPSAEDFRAAARDRIRQLDGFIKFVAVTAEHHDRALARLHEHRPPAETREQYRDCLLWEALLDQDEAERTLVTSDKDFMDRTSANKCLAAVLKEECGGSISFFACLADYLRAVESQIPPMDAGAVVRSITGALLPTALGFIEERGGRLGELVDSQLELYATEDPDATAAVFTLTMSAFDVSLPADTGTVPKANLLLRGDCVLRGDNDIADIAMDRIDVQGLDGALLPGSTLYVRAVDVGGRQVDYSVREPIPAPAHNNGIQTDNAARCR
jgi:hypothetical protein